MQFKVEILYYPKMWLLYCTNKIIIFFRLMTIPRTKVPSKCNSARESALFPQAAPCHFSTLNIVAIMFFYLQVVLLITRITLYSVISFRNKIGHFKNRWRFWTKAAARCKVAHSWIWDNLLDIGLKLGRNWSGTDWALVQFVAGHWSHLQLDIALIWNGTLVWS